MDSSIEWVNRVLFFAHLSTTTEHAQSSFCGCPMSIVCCQNLPCGHSRGHILCSIDLKFGPNVLIKSRMSSNLGHLGSKTRSLGQINEIPGGGSRGHIICSNDLKIGQNVCLDGI